MDETFTHQLNADELDRLSALRRHVATWCNEHQWQIGAAEMALGAALLAAGYEHGAIQMGVDFVVHKLAPGWTAEIVGGASSLMGLATYFVGNVGIVAMGTAFCLPALALAGGATLVLGLAGYGSAKLAAEFLHQAPSGWELLTAGGLIAVGTWLLIDGARRVAPHLGTFGNWAKETGLNLARVVSGLVVEAASAFDALVRDEVAPFVRALVHDPKTGLGIAGLSGVSAAAGAVIAPSLVTVMGSSTLGSVGLALGLVSAPVWPIAVGAGAGLLAGYGVWKWLSGGPKEAKPLPAPPDGPRQQP
jgi:hypothetical protein